MMNIFIGFIIGVVVSFIVHIILNRPYGVLRIDRRSSDKDIYRFDLNIDLEKLPNKSKIILKIDAEADLSHE